MELAVQFTTVRNYTEELCSPLRVEDYIPQPADFASPPKWHLAHTSWFFEAMILEPFLEGYAPFHPDFSYLFNSYYNTIGKRTERSNRGNITRPGVEEVYTYRKYVNKHILLLLEKPLSEEIRLRLITGLHHEQQHQELLLTDLKYNLAGNPTYPVYNANTTFVQTSIEKEYWITQKEGVYDIGHQGNDFCFDNELGRHKVYLPGCQLRSTLVSNSEYLAFIEAGGYANFNYWLDEGWSWRNTKEITHPLYWVKKEDGWYEFTLAGLLPLQPKGIATHLSFYEAHAFATWKGLRLPTEFEWEAASNQLNWGKRWEWTNSAYLPYPRFKIASGAMGEYNGKFMINQMVLRGASCATSKGHSRTTYRNFFHPHYQWQFTGIRLAKDL